MIATIRRKGFGLLARLLPIRAEVRPLSYKAAARHRDAMLDAARQSHDYDRVTEGVWRETLRQMFPWARWALGRVDVVPTLLTMERGKLVEIMENVNTRPGEPPRVARAAGGSPFSVLPAGVALEAAEHAVREVHGAHWLHDPARWSTADGYAPLGTFVAALEKMAPPPPLIGEVS